MCATPCFRLQPPWRHHHGFTTETDQPRMTDTPSRRPTEPSAPESADTPVTPEGVADATGGAAKPSIPAQPPRRSYARTGTEGAAGRGADAGPTWSAAPAWGQLSTAPIPGWEWSGSWIPKPGIVPLRPLGVGEILSGAIALLTRYWRTALTVSAAVAVLSQLVVALVT